MIRGTRKLDCRRLSASASLLCRRPVLATAAPAGACRPCQRRWQSHDQAHATRDTLRHPERPLASPGWVAPSRRPAPLDRQRAPGTSSDSLAYSTRLAVSSERPDAFHGNLLQQKPPRSAGPPNPAFRRPTSPTPFTQSPREQGARSGAAPLPFPPKTEARQWAQLSQRGPPRGGSSRPSQSQPDPLAHLVDAFSRSAKPKQTPALFMQPIAPVASEEKRKEDEFWAHIESKTIDTSRGSTRRGPDQRDAARSRDARAGRGQEGVTLDNRIHSAPRDNGRGKRTNSWADAGSQHRPAAHAQRQQRQQRSQQPRGPARGPAASAVPAAPVAQELAQELPEAEDLLGHIPRGLDLFAGERVANPLEHHRKGRRERPAEKVEKKLKPKPLRRDRGFDEGEDDDYDDISERAEARRQRKEEKRRRKEMELAVAAAAAAAQGPTPILLPELISVGNLGAALRVRPHDFLQQLGDLGFEDITTESIMTGETAALIAQEYGFEPTVDAGELVDLKARPAATDLSTVPARPPIVTIMGHVDHGKTTMLDWLRKSSVAAQEHGGITQHIGAFSVRLSGGKQITFLDTPGHAAFLTMRQRGAQVTDIVILVVAADDSVKPQTLEALKHARDAKVPIIVAVNKIDKEEARVEQVKTDLARHGVEIEDFGGDVQVVCVSGKTGQGMADLEENILTLAEILDVRAEVDGMAEGWVLESSVKPGVGRAASVLVKRGTLRKGDVVAAGTTWARIRTLRNEAGVELDEAAPGTPVEILGWRELPDAGDEVLQAPTEGRAKDATEYRQEIRQREAAAASAEDQEKRERAAAAAAAAAAVEAAAEDGFEKPSAEEAEAAVAAEPRGPAQINFTVKGDVMGSVEAVVAAIMEIGNHEVRPKVLRSAPGPVTEFDVEHAAATQSAIVNFNLPVAGLIKKRAKDAGVAILDHTVIYHLIDDVKAKLSEQLAPTVTSKVLGEAEVLQVFPINIKGRLYKNIAGCRVRNGLVTRNSLYRVVRRGEKIFEGKLESLKQGKKDASEMRKGTECGIAFEDWGDMAAGDMIQAYEEVREKRTL